MESVGVHLALALKTPHPPSVANPNALYLVPLNNVHICAKWDYPYKYIQSGYEYERKVILGIGAMSLVSMGGNFNY